MVEVVETLKCCSINAVTRRQVHKSLLYPAARAPSTNKSHNCSCWSCDSRAGGPGCGLAANAATPPVFQASFHRRTLDTEASTHRAISASVASMLNSRAAIRRRTSNSAAVPLVRMPITTHASVYPVQSTARERSKGKSDRRACRGATWINGLIRVTFRRQYASVPQDRRRTAMGEKFSRIASMRSSRPPAQKSALL